MSGKIQNSPIRPMKTFQPHHLRHLISGTVVFFLGIAANEFLTYVRRTWPRTVHWGTHEIQRNYRIPSALPPTNVPVDVGIAEDGTIVWRPHLN
jgi:hypothetical protein